MEEPSMRINQSNKSMDIEARDVNYILPSYVRQYMFYTKNEMPEKIIFPMFPSIRIGDFTIPIEYVPPLDSIAIEIAKDGDVVGEVTPEQEEILDKKDEEIAKLRAEVEALEQTERRGEEVGGKSATTSGQLLDEAADLELEEDTGVPDAYTPEPSSDIPAARAAFTEPEPPKIAPAATPKPDRKPKLPPGGDIGPGLPLSDMHQRDRRDDVRTRKDLADEPDIDESAEKPFEKEVKRDEKGNPIVEDKPNAVS